MSNNHLSAEEIQSYIQFMLSDDENEHVIAHLSECDACLSRVDIEWEGGSQPVSNLANSRLEKRLMNSINRSNLAGNLIGLGVKGFLGVSIGILTLLLNIGSTKPPRKRK
ncbi:MAG: hypothetical protein HQ525_01105 [Anaerolineae bacterium]|uniref:Zinc-finger domain-containing protein n=1 Tax=Candidatus Desulfolinea nitratireducens TaxID=2841698 RepID=A0A8J6NLE6_9CHLR|nr:hypothetical protein [Candidatus Desulfolinea nitratireducens]MBL6961196.1 hypothetical protein [Anaerolineales bacterium]NQU29244.1 hypothetical protein [Anaerolineae bacterium]